MEQTQETQKTQTNLTRIDMDKFKKDFSQLSLNQSFINPLLIPETPIGKPNNKTTRAMTHYRTEINNNNNNNNNNKNDETIIKRITTTNSTNRDSFIIKNKTQTLNMVLNKKSITENPMHINYQQNSHNLIFIIVFSFFIFCLLIESYMAFSKPNKPINSIIIANNWIVTEPFIVFTTRRRKCIKDKCAPWIENITIIERQLRGDLPREFVEARITISLAYEYIQDTTLPVIVKLKTKFISEKTTKIMTDQVTPTQVLKLERLWREFKPSGTPQNVRRLKLTLNPQKYKKEDDDIKMDEDQNGSNNVLDLNNWQHRYDGIYGITNTFSGLKNSEIFPSTWNVNGQLIPNKKDQQKLPASSDLMGSDQH